MPDLLPLTGLYGKIPAHGDFVRRGLPSSFVTPWDDWLAAGIARAREAMGAHWAEAWDTAPAWRFVLPAGRCGPDAVAGVMLPSMDTVGRRFPITLAALLPPGAPLPEPGWFDALEGAALAGRAGAADADALAAAIPDPMRPAPAVFPLPGVVPAGEGDAVPLPGSAADDGTPPAGPGETPALLSGSGPAEPAAGEDALLALLGQGGMAGAPPLPEGDDLLAGFAAAPPAIPDDTDLLAGFAASASSPPSMTGMPADPAARPGLIPDDGDFLSGFAVAPGPDRVDTPGGVAAPSDGEDVLAAFAAGPSSRAAFGVSATPAWQAPAPDPSPSDGAAAGLHANLPPLPGLAGDDLGASLPGPMDLRADAPPLPGLESGAATLHLTGLQADALPGLAGDAGATTPGLTGPETDALPGLAAGGLGTIPMDLHADASTLLGTDATSPGLTEPQASMLPPLPGLDVDDPGATLPGLVDLQADAPPPMLPSDGATNPGRMGLEAHALPPLPGLATDDFGATPPGRMDHHADALPPLPGLGADDAGATGSPPGAPLLPGLAADDVGAVPADRMDDRAEAPPPLPGLAADTPRWTAFQADMPLPGLSADDLGADLSGLPADAPSPPPGPAADAAGATLPGLQADAPPPPPGRPADAPPAPEGGGWWTRGAAHVPPMVWALPGLPAPDDFAYLLEAEA